MTTTTDSKYLKGLEFYQNIISRLSSNGIKIKAFSLSALTAMISVMLIVKMTTPSLIVTTIITFVLMLTLFIMDTVNLRNERGFRSSYNKLVNNPTSNSLIIKPDFSEKRRLLIPSKENWFIMVWYPSMALTTIPLIINLV